jgi:hypothetical protein
MKNGDKNSNEFGELGITLISFEQCMVRIRFPSSVHTFRRRVRDVITEFGGPNPPIPNYFTLEQLTEFMRNLTELSRIQGIERTRKRSKPFQSDTSEPSND